MEATLTLKAQDQISAPLKQVKANVQSLAAPLKSAGGGLANLGRVIKGASDQAGQGAGRFKQVVSSLKQVSQGAVQLALRMGKLAASVGLAAAALTVKLGRAVIRRVIADFKNLGKAALDAAKDIGGVGAALAQTAAKITALGVGLTYGFKRVFVDLSANVDDFQRRLSNALGDKTLGAEAIKSLRRFSSATGRELADATQAFSALAESGIKPTQAHLDALADMAAKKNKTLAETSEAFKRALKGDAGALEEWGVKSQQIGKSVLYQYKDQTGKMVSLAARANNPEAIGRLLNRVSGDLAGGAEKDRGETMQGGLAKLAAKWAEFRAMIMDSGPFQFLKDELSNILKWVERLEADGRLTGLAKEWGQTLAGALKKVKEGLIAGWEWLKKWTPKIKELITSIGGARTVIIALAAALGGPLIGALGKAAKSIALLGKAIMLTPVGLLIAAGAAIVALMKKAGALEPFIAGLKQGFAGFKEAIGPALTGLLEALGQAFAPIGEMLKDINGNMGEEGWKELGRVIGELTTGVLVDLIKMLTEAVRLMGKVAEFSGGVGEKIADALGPDLKKDADLLRKLEQASNPQERQRLLDEAKYTQRGPAGSAQRAKSDLSTKTYGEIARDRQASAAPDPSRPTPSDIQNPESITGPVSAKLDAVNDTLSRPQDIGNPGDITGPMVPLLQEVAAKVNQPIKLDVSVKTTGTINGANTSTEAKVTGRSQVSDKTQLAMGHRGS